MSTFVVHETRQKTRNWMSTFAVQTSRPDVDIHSLQPVRKNYECTHPLYIKCQ